MSLINIPLAVSLSESRESGLDTSRHVPRSRTGCQICREKKVKCDEVHPQCQRCIRLGRKCDYTLRPRKKYTRRKTSPAPNPEGEDSHGTTSLFLDPGQVHSRSTSPDSASNIYSRATISERGPGTPGQISFLSESISEFSLSPECAHILSPSDYPAIQCFRAVLPFSVDIKDPEHSGTAIIWTLAQESPMVLHMVCALGGLQLCYENRLSAPEIQKCQSDAVDHYGAGLRLLAAVTQKGIDISDLTNVLATLWLMIGYEQKYGDGCGVGLIVHLKGAASLLEGQLRNLKTLMGRNWPYLPGQTPDILEADMSEAPGTISSVAVRMIVWISLIDGGAALNGLGGTFNNLLGIAMDDLADDVALARLRGFSALQKYSNRVYRELWGPFYPQSQIIGDLQNTQLFAFYAEAGQLRFMLSKLVTTELNSKPEPERDTALVSCAIRDVETRYSEFLSVGALLDLPAEESQRRFVANMRFIVPFFHAVVLCFLRITRGAAPLNQRQRIALSEIMSSAFKIYKDEGDLAMARVGWPLFVAALETDDIVHRSWILDRYDSLMKEGENFRRAGDLLRRAFSQQRMHQRKLDIIELLRRSDTEKFVI